MTDPIKLVGVIGSPYSRKMRSVLRYRRIPFHFVHQNTEAARELPPGPLPLIPVVHFPKDGGYEATSDSTFQIRRLESEYEDRSIVPSDPVMAMIDYLIEDFGDEWVTKMMFHYRWAIQENIDYANRILPRWTPAIPEELTKGFATSFGQRQIDRLWVVGSNDKTAPVIEASYRRLLGVLERHLQLHPFLMGGRPGCGDFGVFGQLTQLVQVEHTSMMLAREIAPRVIPWVDSVEDLSGWLVREDQWITRDNIPDTLHHLLREIGRVYAPFLLGNAAALQSKAELVECTVDGETWNQKPFRYQGKCLGWLREAHAALSDADRKDFASVIADTGCEVLFNG